MHSWPDDSIWRLFLLGKAPSSARTGPGLIKGYCGGRSDAPEKAGRRSDRLLFLEPAFRVDRGHAPHPGRRDRLSVAVVVHVSGGEDAFDTGPGVVVHFEVPFGSEVERPTEHGRGRLVSDGDEHAP